MTEFSRLAHTDALGGVATLVHVYGADVGRRVRLDRQRLTIGRGIENDIVCDSDAVSRAHCRIESTPEGDFIEDLGSTNGTFVNDDEALGRRALVNGDYIKIGGLILKYLAGDNIEQLYYEEVYRMAITDGLTLIANRRCFTEFCERELSRCQRHERPLSMILFDLDKFKEVNDAHGHLAGDFVLRRVAALGRPFIRREDCFARFGGEEFAILLPESLLDGAVTLAEKLRVVIAEAEFEYESHSIPVTASFGVATLELESTVETFVKAADDLMYAAKAAGRNCVRS